MSSVATAIKERPILFSGPMVNAILGNRKSQTRRVMKPQLTVDGQKHHKWEVPDVIKLCPYGQVGDRLWVRETLIPKEESAANGAARGVWAYYAADNATVAGNHVIVKTVPSIFMPRWASRITLEITDVRVERLQEITESDAQAEGVREMTDGSGTFVGRTGPRNLVTPWLTAKEAFADGWDTLNFKRGFGWDTNPWAWVIEFKRV